MELYIHFWEKYIGRRAILYRETRNFKPATGFLFSFFVREVYGPSVCKLWVAAPGVLFYIEMQLTSSVGFLTEVCVVSSLGKKEWWYNFPVFSGMQSLLTGCHFKTVIAHLSFLLCFLPSWVAEMSAFCSLPAPPHPIPPRPSSCACYPALCRFTGRLLPNQTHFHLFSLLS